eukprot:scaffold18742_cov106-Isochrysis_galbana.AAC.4
MRLRRAAGRRRRLIGASRLVQRRAAVRPKVHLGADNDIVPRHVGVVQVRREECLALIARPPTAKKSCTKHRQAGVTPTSFLAFTFLADVLPIRMTPSGRLGVGRAAASSPATAPPSSGGCESLAK